MKIYQILITVTTSLLLAACQQAITTAKNATGDLAKKVVTDKIDSTLGVNDYSGCWASSDKVSTIKLVIAKTGVGTYTFSGSETPANGEAVKQHEGTLKELTSTEVELVYTKPMALTIKAKVTGAPKDGLFEVEATSAGTEGVGTRTAYKRCS